MISLFETVPRGPRTARMNGKPKRSLYAAFSCWMRSNSSGVHCVRPALLAHWWWIRPVRLLATMALPASSGWAQIRAKLGVQLGVRTTCQRVLQVRQAAKGRCARASSAIQGGVSYSRQQRQRFGRAGGVEFISESVAWWLLQKSERLALIEWALESDLVHKARAGWCCAQWRAMSMRQAPHLVVLGNVVQKTLQRRDAAGPAQQAAVHADAHHLGRVVASGSPSAYSASNVSFRY